MVIKLNFEKAHDLIDWNFLDFVLRIWIQMEKVDYELFTFDKFFYFNQREIKRSVDDASRGLRRGISSPFFFHFVLEYGLSRLMNKVIEVNMVLGIHLGKEKTFVYHLQFGDDTLFFSYRKEQKKLITC